MQWDLYDVLMILAAYLIGNISPAIILGKISGVDIKKRRQRQCGHYQCPARARQKRRSSPDRGHLQRDFWRCALACSWAMRQAQSAQWLSSAAYLAMLLPLQGLARGRDRVRCAAFNQLDNRTCSAGYCGNRTFGKQTDVCRLTARRDHLPHSVCYYLEPEFLYEGSLMALIILIKHRTNIGRLLRERTADGYFKGKR